MTENKTQFRVIQESDKDNFELAVNASFEIGWKILDNSFSFVIKSGGYTVNSFYTISMIREKR